MDSKAGLAAGALATLRQEGIRPAVIASIDAEIENKVRERVGQILVALRELENNPPSFRLGSERTTLEILEQMLAKLRKETGGAAGALQLLESRLAARLEDLPVTTAEHWAALLSQIAVETATILAEVQRRRDTMGLEVLEWAGRRDHEPFRGLVNASDLEHLAILTAITEARNVTVLFVTLDSRLHAARDEIGRASPGVIITTPTYLRRQIARLRQKQ
jgi:hypothetical protein